MVPDDEELQSVLRQIESIAAVAGLRGSIDREGGVFVMGFATDGGRSQQVIVRPAGASLDGKRVITISSPAWPLPDADAAALTRELALDLLKRNEKLTFARYGLIAHGPGWVVVASSDLPVDTLDAEEFRLHASSVAEAADTLERAIGPDML